MENIHYIVLVLFIAAFVMSVILHEAAHGWMAARCGDYTAEAAGRLSLNPIRHIDPFYTILMPIMILVASGGSMIFGGAKPVPVNPYNFRNMEIDDLKVSVAGVAVNFSIALVCGYLIHAFAPGTVGYTLLTLITVSNLLLGFFNLTPIPPLDGSHVLRFLLGRVSPELATAYERIGRFGFIILLLLIYSRALGGPLVAAVDFVWYSVLANGPVHWGDVLFSFASSFRHG